MKKQDLQHFKSWFASHIATFFGQSEYIDANLKLKEDHTYRVLDEINDIAAKLGLSENDRLIAGTIALFHDVGRFTQFKLYQTYSDPMSVDHCKLSLEILDQNNILDILPAGEQRIIKTAIRIHGQKQIPDHLDPAIVPFARLIRDADKLDIYQLLIKNYKIYHASPKDYPLEVELPDEPGYCSEIYDCILNGRLVNYNRVRTLNDIKILKVGWVYDVNYPAVLEKIKEKRYIEDLFKLLPDNEEMKQLRLSILKYIDERIAAGS